MFTRRSKTCRLILSLIFLIIFLHTETATAEMKLERNGPGIVCSDKLVKTLNRICNNMFNKRVKRCMYLMKFTIFKSDILFGKNQVSSL